MTLETSWTRENMMSSKNSPNNKFDLSQRQNNRRLLIEAELVHRRVEELSNSAWYSDNSLELPEIMPIDTQSPASNATSPILNGREASENASTIENSEVDSKSKKGLINRMNTCKIHTLGRVLVQRTQSLFRKSRSSEIENINILLRPPRKLKIEINHQKYNTDRILSKLKNSFYNQSELEKLRGKVSNLDGLSESLEDQLFNQMNEWEKNGPAGLKNNKRSQSPATLPKTESKIARKSFDSLPSSANGNKLPARRLSTPLLSSRTSEKMCDDNKTNPIDNSRSRYLPSAIKSKFSMKLTPIYENIEINSNTRPASSNKFMTSRKKPTALELLVLKNIINDKELFQDIKQKLQEKCATKSNATFSQNSKEEKKLKEYIANVNKKIYCNHLNENSVASSAAKSFEDSGSSKSPSPTLSSSPNDNWTGKTEMDIKNQKNNPSCNDANIKWIPLPTNLDMPKTSSAFNMKSSRSSSRSSNKSLCVSPVTEDNKNEHFFNNDEDNWTWSCEKNSSARRSFSMKKSNGIFDSGYSEFDNINHSLMIQRFLAEYRATQSFSEFDTPANRRLSFSRASSVFSRSLRV